MKRKYLGVTVFIILTLLTVDDYFPKLIYFSYIPKSILFGLLLVTIIISIIMNYLQKEVSAKVTLLWEITIILYLLALISILTLLGGTSQVGISFINPVLWSVLLICIFQLVREYKKVKVRHLSSGSKTE
jgi:L-asparagine transporter-like permease